MKFLIFITLMIFSSSNLITDKSVDGVFVGSEIKKFVSVVKTRYTVKKEKFMLEGFKLDIFNVYENGKKIYAVEPNEDKPNVIYRIWVYSSKFKTQKGIGVGSTLADIKGKYKIDYMTTEGEGGIQVSVKGCNVTFFLDNSKLPKGWWDTMNMENIPMNIPIYEIIIT